MKNEFTTRDNKALPTADVVSTAEVNRGQRHETLLRSNFLSNVSLELRAPLNTILGFAQLMQSDRQYLTSTQKASLDQILRSGWQLIDKINEILDLSLVDSGCLTLSLAPVSLPEIMSECQTAIEPEAQKRSISVVFPRFESPCFIQAERARLQQVLIHLLTNAIKYNRTGGMVIVSCVHDSPGRIRIKVKDTGAGLSPEKQSQLFQPFNRLGQEAGGEKGLGIGLVISRRLVELMQGRMGMESTPGMGSTFWIELNSEVSPLLEIKKAETPIAAAPRSQLLLYVEDDPENLKLMENLISRRRGMHIATAKNGHEGIALAGSYLPDVILMDINLPDISGVEAMKLIRHDPATAHIPVIALSANALQSDIERGLEEGFFRYLTKPIKFDELIETLNDAFRWGLYPHHKTPGCDLDISPQPNGKHARRASVKGG